jgi:O-antigen/teichoic acid export membrane protein
MISRNRQPEYSPLLIRSPLSLRRNFVWNLLGNVVYAGAQWGLLVVLAKLTNPETVGRFALGLAVTGPIIIFSQLQLRGVQATDAKGEYDFGHYLALRLVTTGLALLAIAAVAGWGGYGRSTVFVILAVGLSKAIESITDVVYGLLQRHERMDRIARSRIIKGTLSIVVMGGVVWFSGNLFFGVLGLAATWGIVMLTYDLRNARLTLREQGIGGAEGNLARPSLMPVFDARKLVHLAWLALPLGFVMTLLSLRSNLPRYFIEKNWGEASLGIFAALAYLILVGDTLVSAMGQSVVSRLAQYYAGGEIRKYRRLLLQLIGMGALIGCVGVAIAGLGGRPILSILYRPEYAEHHQVLTALMFVGGVMYVSSALNYGMMAARCFKSLLPIALAVAGLTGAGALLWIPDHGLMGAVAALAVGGGAQLCGNGWMVVRAVRMQAAKGFSREI